MAPHFPPQRIANITVPSGPLINAAIELVYEHLTLQAFNHVMRSFLFGVVIASHLAPSLIDSTTDSSASVVKFDTEVLALSAILHDLGWDTIGTFVSKDKRFEIDGAIAARDFILLKSRNLTDPGYSPNVTGGSESGSGSSRWPAHRTQLVFDSIALHTQPDIFTYKQPEVRICGLGIGADFTGPDGSPPGSLSWDEYNAIVREYPRTGFVKTVTDIFIGLCREKPETTYENVVGDIGEAYLPGYSRKGHQFNDLLLHTEQVLGP